MRCRTKNAPMADLASSAILWRLLTHFARYRMKHLIKGAVRFPVGAVYYVCPRCGTTLERESCPTVTGADSAWPGVAGKRSGAPVMSASKKHILEIARKGGVISPLAFSR